MISKNQVSRRTFIYSSMGALVASTALKSRALGANNRLRLGVIGCGDQANNHLRALAKMKESDNVEIVAVCDVYQKRLDAAAATYQARPFTDYRALLEQKDLDYVLIATPEHWHTRMTLEAAEAG
jgi:predicted dehydrogenase